MKMKIVYPNGEWLIGRYYTHWRYGVTPGTHHYDVVDACETLNSLIGKRVAVVIVQVKYFILEIK